MWTQSEHRAHPVKPRGIVVANGRAQAVTGETKCSAQGLDFLEQCSFKQNSSLSSGGSDVFLNGSIPREGQQSRWGLEGETRFDSSIELNIVDFCLNDLLGCTHSEPIPHHPLVFVLRVPSAQRVASRSPENHAQTGTTLPPSPTPGKCLQNWGYAEEQANQKKTTYIYGAKHSGWFKSGFLKSLPGGPICRRVYYPTCDFLVILKTD